MNNRTTAQDAEIAGIVAPLKTEIELLKRKWRSDQRLMCGAFQLLIEENAMPNSTELLAAADRWDATHK